MNPAVDEQNQHSKSLLSALWNRLLGDKSGKVMKGMTLLAVGTAGAQVIGFLAIPVLSRLYTPAHFGTLAAFTAFIAIATPFLSLRFTSAIPVPRSDRAAINLTAISLLSSLIITLIIGAAAARYAPLVPGPVGANILANLPLLLLALAAGGMAEIGSSWATRKRHYGTISAASMIQSLAGAVAKILFASTTLKANGLILGQTVQGVIGALCYLNWKSAGNRLHRAISMWRMCAVAKRYASFPIYRLPAHALYVYSAQAPLLFASVIFGPATAGQLSLALIAIALPSRLMASAAGTAYFGEIAAIGIQRATEVIALTRAVVVRLAALAIGPTLILLLFGQQAIPFLLGPQWGLAGQFSSILAVVILFQFCTSPLMHLLNLLRMQWVSLGYNAFRAAGVTLLFIATLRFSMSPLMTIILYSAFMCTFYAGQFALCAFLLNRQRELSAKREPR